MEQPEAAAPQVEGEASAALFGMFQATSTTAMAVTGDVEIDEAGLAFNEGLIYRTFVVGPAELDVAATASAPESLRALMGLESDRQVEAVELRRIVDETVGPASPSKGLCGDAKTRYLALAASKPEQSPEEDGSDPRAPQLLWIAAFSGEDAPGPQAKDSRLCGAFMFSREIAV